MASNRIDSNSEALQYIQDLFIPADQPQEQFFASLTPQQQKMQLSPLEGRILQLLVTLVQAVNIVEIGVLAGYSAITMAQALPEHGHIDAIDRDEECLRLARLHAQACQVEDKITFHHGNAKDQLTLLSTKAPFDMVFIDADKGGYVDYLQWAEQHVRPGGLIVADNCLLFGHAAKPACPEGVSMRSYEVMREFNRRISDQSKYQSIMLPTVEGMVVAIRR